MKKWDNDQYENVYSKLPYLHYIYFHSSPYEDLIYLGDSELYPVIYSKDVISDSNCCGSMISDYFRVNIPLFTESQNFNSCLNKKD